MNKWLFGAWLLSLMAVPLVGSMGGHWAELVVLACLSVIGLVPMIVMWRFLRSISRTSENSPRESVSADSS